MGSVSIHQGSSYCASTREKECLFLFKTGSLLTLTCVTKGTLNDQMKELGATNFLIVSSLVLFVLAPPRLPE